jgi:hypothetical protein
MSDQSLWQRANETPSLDLPFASTESLVDIISGKNLINFTRASTGTYVDANGVIRTAAVNEARFDHNPITGESLGLLVEEQRTNLVLRSEEFDNASWPLFGTTLPTVTANASVAPDGTTTADLWTRSITGAGFISQAPVKAASAIQYTFSVFVKQSVGNFCALRCQGIYPNKVDVVFNLSSGTISAAATVAGGTFTGPSASITPYPNGWYRLTVTATSDTATYYQCCASFNSNGVVIDGTDSVSTSAGLLWGAQLEAGAFPTSYIPTTTAAATRSADVASITGANFSPWYRQDAGTMFAEYIGANPNVNRGVWALTVDTSNVDNIIDCFNGGVSPVFRVNSSGAPQVYMFNGTVKPETSNKVAAAFAQNNFARSLNGVEAELDTAGTMPATTPILLNIGSINAYGVVPLSGTIKRLTYWPQRLPNTTLQKITERDSMSCSCYNPKTIAVIPQYVVKATGDRFFIPAYPELHTKAGDLASCKALSPKGVEKVA